MRKVYLAGAYTERAEISRYIALVRNAGMEITFDWPVYVAGVGKADSDLTHEEAQQAAELDLKGVADADVFWLLIPKSNSKGSWVELGYALGLARMRAELPREGWPCPRIIVSGARAASIFTNAKGIFAFNNHDDALVALCRVDHD